MSNSCNTAKDFRSEKFKESVNQDVQEKKAACEAENLKIAKSR